MRRSPPWKKTAGKFCNRSIKLGRTAFAPLFWTAKGIALPCIQNEFSRPYRTDSEPAKKSGKIRHDARTRGRGERTGHALPAKARGVAHGVARHPGPVWMDFAGSGGVDGEEAGAAANQRLRAG